MLPVLSVFYGIIVRMNWSDHNPPHLHAEYQGQEAVFTFDGNLHRGSLPRKQLRIVQAWIEINQDDLKANWKLAVNNEQTFQIKPL